VYGKIIPVFARVSLPPKLPPFPKPEGFCELGAVERACSCLCAAPGADLCVPDICPCGIKAVVYT